MANAEPEAGAAAAETGAGSGAGRAPRLPRWTRQEILVLIEAKKSVESRGRRGAALVASGGTAPAEPKWTAICADCRRRGVVRGPMQCRKRWSNLASDYKKIKEWEGKGKESFWTMRNDLRREFKLPGFFDREVYEILEGTAAGVAPVVGDELVVFDSGRSAREERLFEEEEDDEEEEGEEEEVAAEESPVVAALPISEKKYEPPLSSQPESSEQAAVNEKQPAGNAERVSPSSHDGAKRRRIVKEGDAESNIQAQLVQVLEKNNIMLTEHLKAQNINSELDREERKEQASNLLGVLNKLADALGRIADKLK